MAEFTFYNLFTALSVIAGMWLLSKLMWMCVYQLKYGGEYGERYYKGLISKEEKEELKRRFKDGWFHGKI
jgi:hypothetical protein